MTCKRCRHRRRTGKSTPPKRAPLFADAVATHSIRADSDCVPCAGAMSRTELCAVGQTVYAALQ